MIYGFADAWTTFDIGEEIIVSNGETEPAPNTSMWRAWRSHNFTATLADKLAGVPREMRFDLPEVDGCQISYIVDERVSHAFQRVDPELPELEAHLCSKIDQEAEGARLVLITPGAGQAMEYDEAAEQATACVAGEPGPFLMLESDVEAGTVDPRTGNPVTTVAEAADLVLFMRDQWRVKGAAIRTARLAAKAAIRAATTRETKEAAALVDWVSLLL